jgi:alginate O-acetyltransferase complex protein AlgI
MLFSAPEFIGLFLPVTLLGFFVLAAWRGREAAILWLILASMFFYGWWDARFLVIFAISVTTNFALGRALAQAASRRKLLLGAGVALNLAVLGYFKYANFFVDNLQAVTAKDLGWSAIVLPIGISFFTFQKIGYLVDCYRERRAERNFLHFALFVFFFPQLISGPIVRHNEILPQFAKAEFGRWSTANMALGLTLFAFGLFKKLAVADSFAAYANYYFALADDGTTLGFGEAWLAALAYTMQIYFDFSGYSEMALGLGRMFGVRLPVNFFSPYKSASIIEFWRRWHITLSRFLRDYLYIPLGGSRQGASRRYLNLLITMLLGGLWHGAGWNFVLWGALHGSYLGVNHAWRAHAPAATRSLLPPAVRRLSSVTATLLAVVVAWVFFRAPHLGTALDMLASMIGRGSGWGFGNSAGLLVQGLQVRTGLLALGLGGVAVLTLPNVLEIMARYRPALEPVAAALRPWQWRPSLRWAAALSVLIAADLVALVVQTKVDFIYFQF